MILHIVNNRWFSVINLLLTSLVVAIWYWNAELGWWLLPVALFPWGLKCVADRCSFKRTPFDIPVFIFIITAVVGVWAAYDRQQAMMKFWQILGAVLVFYAIVHLTTSQIKHVIVFMTLCGASLAVWFLNTHDWQTQSADLDVINDIGIWWMTIRPRIVGASLHPNFVGGILAPLVPYVGAISLHYWRDKKPYVMVLMLVCGLVIIFGMIMTSSRGAWIGLLFACFLMLIWSITRRILRPLAKSKSSIAAIFVLLLLTLALTLGGTQSNKIVSLANNIPGQESFRTRIELAQNSLDLLVDFPFTGAGLAAFPGLYSHYIMVIRVLLFEYSHNFYLDVALEQGLIGLLALLSVMLGSCWLLLNCIDHSKRSIQTNKSFSQATLVGLVVILIHGFMDDTLYKQPGTALLFLLPGIAVVLAPSYPSWREVTSYQFWQQRGSLGWLNKGRKIIRFVGIVSIISMIFVFRRSLVAGLYADLGAVKMTRAELRSWPTKDWEHDIDEVQLAEAELMFHRALQYDPQNHTAHHRLGLVALRNYEFQRAIEHLEQSYQVVKDHRGIQKNLGYAYVWAGQLLKAQPLLSTIEEAREEMRIYGGWWRSQGRDDLSENAFMMESMLRNTTY